jgi:glutathione S-transferase
VRLYDNFASVAAQKVRLALVEKGLAWDTVDVDLRAGAMLDPGYLALNAAGVVPTLIHEGNVLVESTAINEYLDEVFPKPALRPATALGRARMRVWTKRIDEEVHRATGIVSMAVYIRHHHLKKTAAELDAYFARMPDKDRAARQREAIARGMDAPNVATSMQVFARWIDDLDRALADSAWLLGDAFGLADIACIPFVARLDMLAMGGLWREGRRPHLDRWWARVTARPSYRQQIAARFPDAVRAYMFEQGSISWPRASELAGVSR